MNDHVSALAIDSRKLRLYCLRISDQILILGNGGVKTTRTYEEDPKLMPVSFYESRPALSRSVDDEEAPAEPLGGIRFTQVPHRLLFRHRQLVTGQDPFHIPSFCSHYPEFFVNLVNFLIAPAGLSVYRNGGQKNSAAFRPAAFHPFFQDFHSFPAGSFNRTVYSRHPPKDRFPQRIKSGNGNIAGN